VLRPHPSRNRGTMANNGALSPSDRARGGSEEQPDEPDTWRPAEEFVNAIAARDYALLQACLGPQIRFRALIPPGLREREGARETVHLLRSWFEGVDRLEILDRGVKPIAHRAHVWYRLRAFYPDADPEVIEQSAYCEVEGGQITAMDLVCSGYLPEPSQDTSASHRFDAGDLGCGTGLPQEFRHRIEALPIGGVLEVHVRDPSAREDLPSLARLLGHRVLFVRPSPDGGTLLAVERGQ